MLLIFGYFIISIIFGIFSTLGFGTIVVFYCVIWITIFFYFSFIKFLERRTYASSYYYSQFNFKGYTQTQFIIVTFIIVPVLLISNLFSNSSTVLLIDGIYLVYFVIFGFLIGHFLVIKRIRGVGEVHYYAVLLLVHLNEGNFAQNRIFDYYSKTLLGLNKWCMESLGRKIDNLEELESMGVKEMILNYREYREVFINLFNKDFFSWLENFQDSVNLSNALNKFIHSLNFDFSFSESSFSARLGQSLKNNITPTIIAIIQLIIGILIPILL